MAGEPTLYGRMELRLTDAEKRLAKFQGTLDKSMGTMERRTAKAAATMQTSLSNSAVAFSTKVAASAAAAAAAMVSFTSILNGTKGALEEFGNIADKSAQSGLDAEFFQSLKYQASLAGVGMDELSGALSTFNKNSGLAVVSKGKMVTALKALNPELLANIQNAKSQEERVRLVAEAIDREADASRKAAIASAAFGDVGAKLVSVFKGGATVIDETAAKARELGIIVDRDLISRADELGDQFDTATQAINASFKSALISLAPVLVSSANFMAKLAGGLATVIDHLRDLENKTTRGLELNQATNALQRLEIEEKIAEIRQRANGEPTLMDQAELADLQSRRDALKEQDIQITNLLAKRYEERQATKDASGVVNELNDAMNNNNSSTSSAIKSINSYADAIRALKGEIPALSQQLAKLDAESKIDAVYKQAVQKATTIGEVYQANQLRNEAMQAINVKAATSDSSKYLQQFLSADKSMQSLSGMQQQFSQNLATMLASAPKDIQAATEIFSGYRSIQRQQELWAEALKKYGSVEEARKWVAPPGNSQHNMGNAADLRFGTDAARQWFHANASKFGLSFPLGNEPWHIEDAAARSSTSSEALTAKTQALETQATAYDKIIANAQQFIAGQSNEATALTMTADKAAVFRHEQELLSQAQAAGITLTDQQRQRLSELAAGMAQAESSTKSFAASQAQANATLQESSALGKDVFGGIIRGARDGASAAEILHTALIKISDKLIDMSLASLFDGAVAGSGQGILGSLFKPLLSGFSGGGYTGHGGKYDVAGVVHAGEYVIPKRTVDKLGVPTLEAMFRGYAEGGLVMRAPNIPLLAGMGRPAVNERLLIELQDDTGRMASIADQRIQTRSGMIVDVAVKKIRPNVTNWVREDQMRYG